MFRPIFLIALISSLSFPATLATAQNFVLPEEVQGDAERIAEIQQSLKKLGFYWSEADGIYDVGLKNAIAKFVERARERGLSAEKFDLQLSEIDLLIDLAGAPVVEGELGNTDGAGGEYSEMLSGTALSAAGGSTSVSIGGSASASAGNGFTSVNIGGGASASATGGGASASVSIGGGACSVAGVGTCASEGP